LLRKRSGWHRSQGLPHIFDRFYRSTAAVKHTKGAGLGLYLARAIVEAHGGRIWADPKPDPVRLCFSRRAMFTRAFAPGPYGFPREEWVRLVKRTNQSTPRESELFANPNGRDKCQPEFQCKQS
jgi:hypothetical protein